MPDQKYSIHLDEKFGALKLIDVKSFAAQVTDDWFNQTLCSVNDCVVRLGVFKKGEFHWHKHDKDNIDDGSGVSKADRRLKKPNRIVRQCREY